MSDFWSMTRRERQGTVIVLAVIALILVSTMAVRSCSWQESDEVQAVQVQEFEADVDSTVVTVEKKARRTRDEKTKRKPKPRKKKDTDRRSAPSSQPRPLDPVPQF